MTTPPDTEPAGDPYADIPHTADLPPTTGTTTGENTDTPLNVPAPPTLPPGALAGTAGRIVGALSPHTEADPAALLVTLLAWFGAMVGNGPHVLVSNTQHPARLWPLIVGKTSGGAKGTSLSVIRALMRSVDPTFSTNVTTGLTSGEGLIESVRDAGDETDPDSPEFDEGVLDKRRLIVESEFAAVLARGRRDSSTLLPVMRDAWDGSPLQTMARKRNALAANDHHIVVIGHVSPTELLSTLRTADLGGGTVNRFLPVYSQRAGLLPDGGNVPDEVLHHAAADVAQALASAGHLPRRYTRAPDAAAYWPDLYAELCRNAGDDPAAQATARAPAQVLRLALAYALIDGDTAIRLDHLTAAAALWFYCADTAQWLFTTAAHETAHREHTQLLDFIATAGTAGVTRTDIRERLYQRHKSSDAIDAILAPLLRAGRITETTERTAGRPRARYSIPNRETP